MRKNLLVLGMSVVTVVAVTFFAVNENAEQTYVPRTENKANGIEGAFEFYAKMRADLRTGEVNQRLILQRKAEIDAQVQLQKRNSAQMDWEEMGPSNVGGRTRAIITLDNNLDDLLAGSTTGGLYKTNDGGDNWEIVSSFDQSLAISAMCQLGNGWILVGTGCDFESAQDGKGGSGSRGDGLFISKDNGNTWTLVQDDQGNDLNYNNNWRFFHRLVADKNHSSTVWMACNSGRGLVKMDLSNGIFESKTSYNGMFDDVVISPSGNVIIAVSSVGSGRYFRSEDGGQTFFDIGGGLSTHNNRSTLAYSPDDEAYVYALQSNSAGAFGALYYSADTGQTWTLDWQNPSVDPFVSANGQGRYDQAIAVVPNYPRLVVVAGVTVWLAGPDQNPEQIAANFAPDHSPNYVHSDVHHLSWVGADKLLIGCDGGVHIGTFNGFFFNFQRQNSGYNVTQFYNIGINGRGEIIGGTQDNGTQFINPASSNPMRATEVLGGDGFTCELSNLVEKGAIASIYNGDYNRTSELNTTGFSNFVSTIPNVGQGGFYTTGALFEKEFDYRADRVVNEYENITDDTMTVGTTVTVASKVLYGREVTHVLTQPLAPQKKVQFADKTSVMYAVDQGLAVYLTRDVWDFDGSPEFWKITGSNQFGINKMSFSPDGDCLYLAKTGNLVRIKGLRNAWHANEGDVDSAGYVLDVQTVLFEGNLSDVAVDRSNPDHVVAVRYGYGARDDEHVFETFNATSSNPTWEPLVGDFPDIPVYAVEIDYTDPSIIYLGTEEGVYVTEDGGETWINQVVNGVSRVPVFDLRIQHMNNDDIMNTGVVYAGTHGRGFFRMENRNVTTISERTTNDVTINNGLSIFPNPIVDNATISFDIAKNNNAQLTVLNANGQVVKQINAGNLTTIGVNNIEFNVSELPVGMYMVHLNNGSDQRVGRFIKRD